MLQSVELLIVVVGIYACMKRGYSRDLLLALFAAIVIEMARDLLLW